MLKVDIDELTYKATMAALEVIDSALDNVTKQAAGSCGDKLAFALSDTILKALRELDACNR